MKNLVEENTSSEVFIKKFIGSQEFIRGEEKYCLWIEDINLENAKSIVGIRNRIKLCENNRLSSNREATRVLAKYPHKFGEIRFENTNSIIIPRVSSEKREYLTVGFLDTSYVISDRANAIYDCEPWVFSLISSKIHTTWIRSVCGRLKMDINYSTTLGYNTFPLPPLSKSQKEELERHVYRILEEREAHSEKTLAQLYDPDKMPDGLREAHRQNDLAVERIYRSKPFESDEERLAYLFKLYEQMIAEEKARAGELNFEKVEIKKKRKT